MSTYRRTYHDMTIAYREAGHFSSNFGKRPLDKIGKNDRLNIKINDIEHNMDSKIYPQNQINLDCNMSSIPLKPKCLNSILIWAIVSQK